MRGSENINGAAGIDPQCVSAVETFRAARPPATQDLTPQAIRDFAASLWSTPPAPPLAGGVERREVAISAAGGGLRCALFSPQEPGPLPIVVHLHGGGWVFGSVDAEAALSARIAASAGCLVLSVEYRLAPEHRFPAALEDAYAAIEHVAEHGAELGADPTRIAVFGGSAGANLAAAVALLAAERGTPSLACQVLMVPALQHYASTPSRRDNGADYDFLPGWLDWFSDQYLGARERADDPHAAPLRAESVAALPPTLIGVAEFCPVHDDGIAYAEKLRADDVPVRLIRYEGMIHSFLAMAGVVDRADEALEDAASFLREHLRAVPLGATSTRRSVG